MVIPVITKNGQAGNAPLTNSRIVPVIQKATPSATVKKITPSATVKTQPKFQISQTPVNISPNMPGLTFNKPSKPTKLPSGITLNFVTPTQQPSATLKPTAKPTPQAKINVVKIQEDQKKLNQDQLSQIFPQTTQTVDELFKDPLSLKANPTKIIDDVWNSLKPTVENALKNQLETYNPPKTVSGQIALKAKRITDVGNILFTPVTTIFTIANDVPVLSSLAKVLSLPFLAVGEGAGTATSKIIDSLPIPDSAKKTLKLAFSDLASLAAQVALGIGVAKLTPSKAALIDKYGETDANTIIREATKLGKTEVKKEYTPNEVIDTVIKNKLEETPEGKALVKTAMEAQKQEKNIQIEEAPKVLETPTVMKSTDELIKYIDRQGHRTEEQIAKLRKDIETNGIKYPVEITKKSDGTFQIDDGTHRIQIAKDLGIKEIPTKVRDEAKILAQEKQVKSKPVVEAGLYDTGIAKPNQISPMGRVKTAELENVFKQIPDGATEPKGYFVKKGDKIFPTEKATPEILKNSRISLNPDGSLAEKGNDFSYSKINFTEDVALNPRVAQQPISDIKPKTVKVPREQLPVSSKEGVEKVSKLEARITANLKKTEEKNLSSDLQETYKQMNNKDQIKKASEYVVKNADEALEVIKGNKPAPKGLLQNAIFVAMHNLAEGDVALARKIASLRSTRFGQEIEILKEIDPNSPVSVMRDIIQVREANLARRYSGRSVNEVKKAFVEKGKKQVKAPPATDWGSIIREVRC